MTTAEAAPDNVFLCAPPAAGRAYHPDGVEFTYRETRDAALRLRQIYAAAGYGHGHRVALLLENRPEFFFHYLALNALGAGIVPINPDYRHDEMAYQMEHSEADLAVVIASRSSDLDAVARERDKPLPVVSVETMTSALPPCGTGFLTPLIDHDPPSSVAVVATSTLGQRLPDSLCANANIDEPSATGGRSRLR